MARHPGDDEEAWKELLPWQELSAVWSSSIRQLARSRGAVNEVGISWDAAQYIPLDDYFSLNVHNIRYLKIMIIEKINASMSTIYSIQSRPSAAVRDGAIITISTLRPP